MVTINTTFHVEDIIDNEFQAYIKNTYIREAVADKLLIIARLCRIHSQEIEGGQSYSVQFTFNNLKDLENWDKTNGKKLNEELVLQFKDKIAGFSTLLEEIKL
jgi:hypothetical protein